MLATIAVRNVDKASNGLGDVGNDRGYLLYYYNH